MMLLLFGLVLILVDHARQPGFWRILDMLSSPSRELPPENAINRQDAIPRKDSTAEDSVEPKQIPRDQVHGFGDATARGEDKTPESPRALFSMLGVEDGFFDRLTDGGPIKPDENETLLRVLFRLRQFPPMDVERWALDSTKLAEALGRPADFRGSIFRLRGRVLEVEPCRPPENAAQRFELARYYRCRLKLDGSSEIAEVYTENVPKEWQKGAKPDVAGGAFGVFLKLEGKAPNSQSPVFAAPRLAWYPNDLLGQLGMDFGLLDSVEMQKPFNPVNPDDREAFYQMLAAAGRAKPGQLLRQADDDLPNVPESRRWNDREGREQYSVVPLFNSPASQLGRLTALTGTARLVQEIRVDDPDIIARFGIRRYYQVSLFTEDSLSESETKIPGTKGDLVSNPVTFCILDLPEGMPFGAIPRYGESVRIAGFFFKTWSYRVPKMTDPALSPGNPKTHHQLSPMLIGRDLSWQPAAKPANTTTSNYVVGGLLFLVMVIAWGVAWKSSRREKRWVEQAIGESPKFEAGIDLDDPARHADGSPDFSHLAEMDHGPEKSDSEKKE